jgi:hypothetical protein
MAPLERLGSQLRGQENRKRLWPLGATEIELMTLMMMMMTTTMMMMMMILQS